MDDIIREIIKEEQYGVSFEVIGPKICMHIRRTDEHNTLICRVDYAGYNRARIRLEPRQELNNQLALYLLNTTRRLREPNPATFHEAFADLEELTQ